MRVHEAAFDYIPESGVEDIIFESIAANSTAHLDEAAGSVKVLGNPTEELCCFGWPTGESIMQRCVVMQR